MNLTGSWTKRNYNDNATGSYYSNPFYITRYMAPVYPVYMHNADGSYQLDEMVKRFMIQLLHIWATVISLMKCCSIKKKAFVMY